MPCDQTARIAELTEQMQNLLPTPCVGDNVQWFPNNDDKNPHAAIVTAVEDPGRVALTVFARNAEPKCFLGVFHKNWPGHTPGNPDTVKRGGWDYINGNVPKAALQRHREQVEAKLRIANADHEAWEKEMKAAKEAAKAQKELAGAGK